MNKKNREEIQKIFGKSKELLKKDREELVDYIDRKNHKTSKMKNYSEIEKELEETKEQKIGISRSFINGKFLKHKKQQ